MNVGPELARGLDDRRNVIGREQARALHFDPKPISVGLPLVGTPQYGREQDATPAAASGVAALPLRCGRDDS